MYKISTLLYIFYYRTMRNDGEKQEYFIILKFCRI
jgi:hypothetical protein